MKRCLLIRIINNEQYNQLADFILYTYLYITMAFQMTDEGIFDISKILYSQLLSEKNMKQLDRDNLKQFKNKFIKPLYPHKEQIKNGQTTFQKYQCGEYCCELDPGRFCCCSTKPPDKAYRQFGLGMCLYTKFLKHLSIFLFFVSLFAILSIVAYWIVTIQTGLSSTEEFKKSRSQTALYSTTVGTLSSELLKCDYKQLVANQPLQFNLNCPIGQLKLIGPVHTNRTMTSLRNCRLQKQSTLISSSEYTSVQTNLSANNRLINLTFTNNNSELYIAYNYECVNSQFNIANNKIQISKVVYFTVGIDIVIVILFVFFLISQHNAQSKEIQNFKAYELAVHDFTVKISGFHVGDYENQLDKFIYGYTQMINHGKSTQENFIDCVVQVKIPEVEQIKQATQNRRDIYEQLYDHMYNCFFEDEVDIFRYKNAQDFIKKCYGNSNSESYKEYKRILQNLVQKFMESKRIKYLEGQIDISILMVLANPKHKKEMIRRSKNQCCGNYIQIENKKFQVNEPPVADMIIWENKNKFTFLRVIFAWIITLAIVFGSYLLIGFAYYSKQVLINNNNFEVDCGLLFPNVQMTNWSTTYEANPSYLHCYCNQNYFSLNTDLTMRTKCSVWIQDYLLYASIPILISFGILVYNLIVSRIFRVLSRFQAHENLSSELYSYIIKRSFVLIMNMGLIIILLKIQYNTVANVQDFSFLFSGQYPDITSDWYLWVGGVIMLTLLLNIALPFLDMIVVSFLKCLRKCWDRKCCCVQTSQKTKKGYIELYSNDIFPIQERYSHFIALMFICLAFSAVMPLLYIVMFLSIWFMFVTDKFLLFRIYQKPINFNQNLQNNVFKIFYIGVMVHCVVSPFLLSEDYLSSVANISTNLDRFRTILITPYLIPYVVIFLLLAVWAVFYSTIVNSLTYCIKKCQKQVSKIYKSKLHQNFFNALNQYQITKLMMSVQGQLHRNVEHEKNKKVSSHTIICQNTMKKLREAEKALKTNQRDENNIRLIGKAGYEEMFDDEILYRQRKIKSLDYQFTEILKRESYIKKTQPMQETLGQIN